MKELNLSKIIETILLIVVFLIALNMQGCIQERVTIDGNQRIGTISSQDECEANHCEWSLTYKKCDCE